MCEVGGKGLPDQGENDGQRSQNRLKSGYKSNPIGTKVLGARSIPKSKQMVDAVRDGRVGGSVEPASAPLEPF